MIYTVTVNPALDLNIDCSERIKAETIRTRSEKRHAGGKGIDVSRVVRNLGGSSVAMGFLGGFTGRSVEGLLLQEGLELDFVPIAEETRTNVIIDAPEVDPSENDHDPPKKDHRLNAKGPAVQPIESLELFRKIRELRNASIDRKPTHAAVCGSLAREMKATYYANIIRYFKELGARVYLDTSGSALKEALRYPPWPDIIKPNIKEFNELRDEHLIRRFSGERMEDTEGKKEGDEALLERLVKNQQCGVKGTQGPFWTELFKETLAFCRAFPGVIPLLTCGPAGILLPQGDQVLHASFAPPPGFQKANTVGAGDAALAGFIWALESGRAIDDALKYAVAASAAAVTMSGTEAPEKKKVDDYFERVTVHPHLLDTENVRLGIVEAPGTKTERREAERRRGANKVSLAPEQRQRTRRATTGTVGSMAGTSSTGSRKRE